MVRPLVGTGVTPNHLTTLRLASGLAACGFLALGTDTGAWWGGGLWLASAFLDRADGELARIGNMMSPGGHLYDYYVDQAVNVLFFIAIGFGLQESWLGAWSVPLGFVAGISLLVCNWWSELLERASGPNVRAYSGKWGFDPDDALYLMGPLAWLHWLSPILVGAAIATPIIMTITGIRLQRIRAARASATPGPAGP
ncbi:CDP-alcohol phosphatidyltransferase family protein [Zavarzinia sp. CC-PAN008]|uniref:CDP-alcohol phosphatidyltransferase family protein n=1 Tax=Zavarzinia sp. CC-PAN008 TaxID=3243332 RepID=UPI003F745177